MAKATARGGKAERRRASYAKAFKLEAVRLLESVQKPAAQLTRELGVQRNQLYKWQAELRAQVT